MHKIVFAAFIIASTLAASTVHAQERGYAGLTLGASKIGVLNSAGQRVRAVLRGIELEIV